MSSVLFLALGVVGCACPRYDVRVAAVPVAQARADWVAVRIDRHTGQAWYSYNKNIVEDQKPEWRLILGGVEPQK